MHLINTERDFANIFLFSAVLPKAICVLVHVFPKPKPLLSLSPGLLPSPHPLALSFFSFPHPGILCYFLQGNLKPFLRYRNLFLWSLTLIPPCPLQQNDLPQDPHTYPRTWGMLTLVNESLVLLLFLPHLFTLIPLSSPPDFSFHPFPFLCVVPSHFSQNLVRRKNIYMYALYRQ